MKIGDVKRENEHEKKSEAAEQKREWTRGKSEMGQENEHETKVNRRNRRGRIDTKQKLNGATEGRMNTKQKWNGGTEER